MDSILTSIKKLLGFEEQYTQFDADIIMAINTVLVTLTQIGVGSADGFVITGKDSTWEDFLGTRKDLELVKTYVYLKTRLLFDPPQSSALVEVINTQLKEIEYRIYVMVDQIGGFVNE